MALTINTDATMAAVRAIAPAWHSRHGLEGWAILDGNDVVRARDAERTFAKLVKANQKRVAELGLDLARDQRESFTEGGPLMGFEAAFRHVVETQPIPQSFIDKGVEGPAHYRKILLAVAIKDGLADLFAKALGEQMSDNVAAMLATIDAAGVIVAGAYDINQWDDAGFAEIIVDEFRGVVLRTVAYWREKKGGH